MMRKPALAEGSRAARPHMDDVHHREVVSYGRVRFLQGQTECTIAAKVHHRTFWKSKLEYIGERLPATQVSAPCKKEPVARPLCGQVGEPPVKDHTAVNGHHGVFIFQVFAHLFGEPGHRYGAAIISKHWLQACQVLLVCLDKAFHPFLVRISFTVIRLQGEKQIGQHGLRVTDNSDIDGDFFPSWVGSVSI